jgi:hypothetical protein
LEPLVTVRGRAQVIEAQLRKREADLEAQDAREREACPRQLLLRRWPRAIEGACVARTGHLQRCGCKRRRHGGDARGVGGVSDVH